MPRFVMIGWDGPEGPGRRDRHRAAHLDYVRTLQRDGRITFAGPIRNEDDEHSIGVVIVLEAPALQDAKALVDRDPYVAGGVFKSITVHPFRQVIPEPP
jgi:uncharacterized protein YciI